MDDDGRRLQAKCPRCAGTLVEGRGCVVGVAPYERPPDPFGRPRPEKVIEYKYRCVGCGEDFSTIESF